MSREPNMERVRHFAEAVAASLARVTARIPEPGREDTPGAHGMHAMLRIDAAHVRDQAQHLAHFAGAREPDLLPEATVRRVLTWAASRLADEQELVAAQLLTDEETWRAALVQFCGEEPPGAGRDPYDRPDPHTHPEAWTE